MEKMKSVAVVDECKVELVESRLPNVLAGDVLVKVRACMLCTFEQRIFRRVVKTPLPFVPGHEIIGEVAGVGEGVNPADYPLGQKVVARLLYSCGECYYCRTGHENHCINRSKQPSRNEIMGMGGLGQYLSVEARQVWKVDNTIEDNIGIFAEPLACVVNSMEIGDIGLGEDVLVIGGGIMGQLHVMVAKLQGGRVIMSEPDETRRELAKKLGADLVVNPLETDLEQYIKELTSGRGVEVIFNTTAVSELAAQSITLMAVHGRNVAYSSQHPDKPYLMSPNWLHDHEPIVTGAVSPTIRSFDKAVNLLNKGLIDPRPLLAYEFPLDKAQEAFEQSVTPGTMRVKINLYE